MAMLTKLAMSFGLMKFTVEIFILIGDSMLLTTSTVTVSMMLWWEQLVARG
jgi:hypothetical protein